jgi:hypothetical protein
MFFSITAMAGTAVINGKKLSRVRVVGDYPGTTFDNSVELWFTTPIAWPSTVNCTNTARVYIDAKYTHLVSAAYMALAAGKIVNLHVDDQLTNRAGSCEISFLDD